MTRKPLYLLASAAALAMPAGAAAPPFETAALGRLHDRPLLGRGALRQGRRPAHPARLDGEDDDHPCRLRPDQARRARARPDVHGAARDLAALARPGGGLDHVPLARRAGQRAQPAPRHRHPVGQRRHRRARRVHFGHRGRLRRADEPPVARDWASTNSHWGNPVGWPDDGVTYTTARDLATLAAAHDPRLSRALPRILRHARVHLGPDAGRATQPITQGNRNPLLGRVAGADGLKTGHTEEAGYGFTGSAEQNGRRHRHGRRRPRPASTSGSRNRCASWNGASTPGSRGRLLAPGPADRRGAGPARRRRDRRPGRAAQHRRHLSRRARPEHRAPGSSIRARSRRRSPRASISPTSSSRPATCRRRPCRWSPRTRSARPASSAASGTGLKSLARAGVTRARFITLEGGEGVGKSTQAKALAAALRARGIDVVETREPGGSPAPRRSARLLLQGEIERWTPEAEALLFAAARSDHVARTIRPALERGQWVLCDRFLDSSIAYQGGAGGLGFDAIRALHEIGSRRLPAGPHPAAAACRTARRERAPRSRDVDGADRIGGRGARLSSQGRRGLRRARRGRAGALPPRRCQRERRRGHRAPARRARGSAVTPLYGHDAAVAAFRAGARRGPAPPCLAARRAARASARRCSPTRRRCACSPRRAGPRSTRPGLDVPDDHPIARLVAAGSHPDLMRLERLAKESGTELARSITVDQVRGLQRLFATTAVACRPGARW